MGAQNNMNRILLIKQCPPPKKKGNKTKNTHRILLTKKSFNPKQRFRIKPGIQSLGKAQFICTIMI